MSTPTQVIKFAGIHNESVGSLGAQALGEWEGLPIFHVQRSATKFVAPLTHGPALN